MQKNGSQPVFGSPIWRLSEWVGIALYGVLVFQYVTLWQTPGAEDGARIATLTTLVIFEFVLAHSAIFMAAFPRKIALFIFVPFYGLFAWAMNASVPGNTVALLYAGVVLIRMRFIFSDPSESAKMRALGMSVISMALFMVCIITFSANAERLPEWGLTEAYLTAINFRDITGTSGDFIDNPHAAMAMGATYFTLVALAEIWVYGLLRKRKAEESSGKA